MNDFRLAIPRFAPRRSCPSSRYSRWRAASVLGAAIVLGTVGAAAGWLPAHRASRIDPADVLRES